MSTPRISTSAFLVRFSSSCSGTTTRAMTLVTAGWAGKPNAGAEGGIPSL
ncbi:hypothetical protein ACFWPK_19565 [Nocardia sp. NPDC058519]